MRWKVLVWGLALALGLLTVMMTARVSTPPARVVSLEQRGKPERLVLVFIDSLTHDVATNAELMPELGRLARRGAAFDVEPCRDQLTYLCLRAALTGHDDSSLLAVADNFRPSQEGPPATLLSAAMARGLQLSVIGTHDFHPYRRALASEKPLAKQDESPERVLALLAEARREQADVVLVSLGSGDMAAHAHGTKSPEYAAAFRRLDSVVGAVQRSLSPHESLVVFGDHGHDALGRHLPGTSATTFAVYQGQPFREGSSGRLRITDHRALLGTLLGVPSEASYSGPELTSVFRAEWLDAKYDGRAPRLAAVPAPQRGAPAWRWASVLALTAAFVLSSWILGARSGLPVGRWAALASAAALALGAAYDPVRRLVHDHGDSPERGLCLLVPLAAGLVVASTLRPQWSKRPSWLPSAAASSVIITFCLLLPTSYYYGARRAVALAGALGIGAVLLEAWRRPRHATRELVLSSLSLALVAAVLVSLHQVEQLGPETGGAATWRLASPIYTHFAWLPLTAAKLLLATLVIAPRAERALLDAAVAAALLSVGVLIQLGGFVLPRELYAALFAALVLGVVLARRDAACSLFSAGLLLLNHLYGRDISRLAPLESIVASVALVLWAAPRLGLSRTLERVLAGLAVVLGLYLMLWPTVGFHLAGIDFGYMFQWVPENEYERYWRVIALGLVLKLALPLLLVLFVARRALCEPAVLAVVGGGFCAKTALLSLMIVSYAATHDMGSQQALAMLAELLLLLFVVCTNLVALPWRVARGQAPAMSVPRLGSQPRPS